MSNSIAPIHPSAPCANRPAFSYYIKISPKMDGHISAAKFFLDNETKREEITLDDISVGRIINKPIWREMLWLEKDSVLCVAASDYYKPEDYMRDYGEFKEYLK